MPRYSTVKVDDIAQKLQLVTDSLGNLAASLRVAKMTTKTKRASPAVMKDAVAMATGTPNGCEIAELWLKFNGVVDSECIKAAMQTIRETVSHSSAVRPVPAPTSTLPGPDATKFSHRCCKFLMEHDLMEWVETQNVQKGIAPARAQVWKQRIKKRSCTDKVSATRKGQRQWCKRWRRRWGLVTGRVQCREKLLDKEMQEKVRSKFAVANSTHVVILGSARMPPEPKQRPPGGTSFRSVRQTLLEARDPKTVPILKRFSAADVI